MQVDQLHKAMEGLGNILVQFQQQQDVITPFLEQIKGEAHNIDPSLMAKYNETMKDVDAKKAELAALQDSLKDKKI